MYTVIDLIETGGPLGTETITKETNIRILNARGEIMIKCKVERLPDVYYNLEVGSFWEYDGDIYFKTKTLERIL